MEFEWDQQKNQANYDKHGINFELARKVFDDPFALYSLQAENSEERWVIMGMAGADRQCLLVVVHTYRNSKGQEVIRIISARPASNHERKLYEEGQ